MKKIKAYSREKLFSDLINGRIQLKDVPKSIRMKGISFYIAALRYYRYVKTIDSPFEVMYDDINSLPEGYEKQRLLDFYNDSARFEGQSYERRKEYAEIKIFENI